jgi:hypothetical protein
VCRGGATKRRPTHSPSVSAAHSFDDILCRGGLSLIHHFAVDPNVGVGVYCRTGLVYGAWCMVHGVWCMVYGVWCMV